MVSRVGGENERSLAAGRRLGIRARSGRIVRFDCHGDVRYGPTEERKKVPGVCVLRTRLSRERWSRCFIHDEGRPLEAGVQAQTSNRGKRRRSRVVVVSVAEVAHDVELVEDDSRLWCMAHERGTKGLPHVHRGELDARRLVRAQCGEEEVHVSLGAALAADPDRPPPVEVADDDAVVVSLPDGDLVHADCPRRGQSGAGDLLLHVDRIEVLDRAVVEALRLGHRHRRVGHLAAERAHVHGEALSEARVLRQPVEALYVHAAAPRAVDPPAFELDVDPQPARREVAGAAGALVVATAAPVSTLRAACRFFRRRNTRTLA